MDIRSGSYKRCLYYEIKKELQVRQYSQLRKKGITKKSTSHSNEGKSTHPGYHFQIILFETPL